MDETAAMREADGYSKPPEMDNTNFRAELESDWMGWEAPALLEVELSRDMEGEREIQPEQRSMMRNSILRTPVEMVGRKLEEC